MNNYMPLKDNVRIIIDETNVKFFDIAQLNRAEEKI
jgi:hypothetical protein